MAFPVDFRLDHTGGDHREYPRAAAHQVVWTTVRPDASPDCRIDDRFLAVPCFLEICVAPLLQRELVNLKERRLPSRRGNDGWEAVTPESKFLANPLARLAKCS